MVKRKSEVKKGHGIEIDIADALEGLSRDKDIDAETIKLAIGEALIDTAKKKISKDLDLECEYNPDDKKFELYQFKKVVEEFVENEYTEISLDEALEYDPEITIGEEIGIPFEMNTRIDAYVARTAIIRKIREAEKKMVYNEFKMRVGELITGNIKNVEGDDKKSGAFVVDIGKTEAVLYAKDKPEKENLRLGDKVQAIIIKVEETPKDGYIVKLSRKDPKFLIKLFEKEVPEIYEGVVEIKDAVRDPGKRAKVAVYSTDPDTDPVGACVGLKGQRVKNIVTELKGEKVDIVVWSPNEVKFACNAIAPANVVQVIQDDSNRTMDIIVPNEQLSLAIGKKGQNVKLASKLVKWELRILSEADHQRIEEKGLDQLSKLTTIDSADATALYKLGFKTLEDIVDAPVSDFPMLPGFNKELISKLKDEASEFLRVYGSEVEREKEIIQKNYLEQLDEEDDEENETTEELEEKEDEIFLTPEEIVLSMPGVDQDVWIRLNVADYYSVEDILKEDSIESFAQKGGFSFSKAKQIINAAKQTLRKLKRKNG
ncbi:transcription termination factor NusA [bacterium]|nr:transcription termination factor NusA [bacterium]